MDPLLGGTAKIFFRYAIPSVLGILLLSLSIVVDAMFIGHYVGSNALAAVNITFPINYLIMGVALMFATGSAAISGKLIGEKRSKSAALIFNQIFILVCILSVVFSFVGLFFLHDLLILLGANAQILPLAADYLSVNLKFTAVLMLATYLYYFSRIDNMPTRAAVVLVCSSVMNIVLNWLFIVQYKQGLSGAAWASGLSQLIIVVAILPHFMSKKTDLKLTIVKIKWRNIVHSAANGSSEMLNQGSVAVITLLFNWILISHMGINGVAAFSVVSYLLWFGLTACFAISDTLQPLISKNFGARLPQRISRFLGLAMASVLAIGICVSIVLLMHPEFLVAMFMREQDKDAFQLAIAFIFWIWPAFLFGGINIVISGYFTAMHNPLYSGIISIARGLCFPVIGLMILPLLISDIGLFIVIPIAEVLTCIIAISLFLRNPPNKILGTLSLEKH